jgi:hypothetical protein
MGIVATNEKINVNFLGKAYSFPCELGQYVMYCQEFEQINDRLMSKLLCTMKKKPLGTGDDNDDAYTDIRKKFEGYMEDEGRKIISKLSQIGIYDVTESDVIYSNKGYKHYADVKAEMEEGSRKILLNAMDAWFEGQKRAYSSATSNITGSGVSLWSSSLLDHAAFAATEYSVLKKQAKQANREYVEAIHALNIQNESQRDREYVQFYANKIYPEIANAFTMFTSELTALYMEKLKQRGLFDYTATLDYDLGRSAELLKNIKLVDDKKTVLQEAFKICPYNPDIYAEVINQGLFDVDSLKAAKEFHQETMLISVIEDKIKGDLKNVDKVMDYIDILSYYEDKDRTEILLPFYQSTIDSIKNDYHEMFLICSDSRRLDRWISENINSDMDKVVSTSDDMVKLKVESWAKWNVHDDEFAELANMGLISIEDIRMKDSVQTNLEDVRMEYVTKLVVLILDYIKEAGVRKVAYEEAYDKFNAEVQKRNDVISEKRAELKKQGIFAFSSKKEIKAELEQLEKDLEDCRKTEPIHLKDAYYGMYA